MRYIDDIYGIPVRYTDQLTDRVQLLTSPQGLYTLKKQPNSTKATHEAELLHFLHSRKIAVPIPIKTKKNSFIFMQENSYYTLSSYISGSPLSTIDLLSKPDYISIIGSKLGTMHDALLDHETSFFRKRHLAQSLFSNAIPFLESHEIALDVVSILRRHEQEIKQLLVTLPVQIIHREPHFNHFIFENNQFAGILDFEFAEENIRLFDPCYFATSLLNEVYADPSLRGDWLRSIQTMFGAYHRTNPLTYAERKSIGFTMLGIEAIIIAFFSHDRELVEKNRSMFLWLYENKNDIDRVLHLR